MQFPIAIEAKTVNAVNITTYTHPKEAIITGRRNGLTALLYRNIAIGPVPAPFSLRLFNKGCHALRFPLLHPPFSLFVRNKTSGREK